MSTLVTRDEIMALFFPERYGVAPPPPKPKPKLKVVSSAELSIEIERQAAQRRLEQLAQRERAEREKAEREAQRIKDEEKRREWMVAQRQAALDAFWERKLANEAIERTWRDPCGLYGPPTLATPVD